jgi:predicted permease
VSTLFGALSRSSLSNLSPPPKSGRQILLTKEKDKEERERKSAPMKLWTKFTALFRRQKLDAEMSEEMRLHLERRTEENVGSGMSPEEARYEALRKFGGIEQVKETARDQRSWLWLEQARQDLRHAFGSLVKSPGFTVVAVLSLGLGIGACTAVFSLAHTILLRSLPVPNPDHLRVLQWTGTNPRIKSFTGEAKENGNRVTANSVSPPMFLSLREQTADVADVFAFAPLTNAVVRARHEAFTADALIVSDNFFTALGVRPIAGHLFAPGDATARDTQQVVITDAFWEKHFARDRDTIGQPLTLNGATFTIAGVLPRSFPGVQEGESREFYVLLAAGSPFLERPIDSSAHWWVRLMARMKPGASDARLKAALDVVFPREAATQMDEPRFLVSPGRGGQAAQREFYRKPLLLMAGVVTLVMLVACFNVAGLSLARGATRHHELAVRAALGANRARLIRQSLTESVSLALLGGGLGVVIAFWSREAITHLLANSASDLKYDFSLDFTLLGFALLAALATAVISGLLPALAASRVDAMDGLKARGALGAPRLRLGQLLVAAQIALSLLLLSAAGLLGRSLINLKNVDAGFPTENLLVFRVNPSAGGFDPAQRTAFYARVQDALAEIPGVRNAAAVMHPLLENADSWGGSFSFRNRATPPSVEPQANRLVVGETFFATAGIPLLSGRGFTVADAEGSTKVIVVNETFARRYFATEDSIGQVVNVVRSDWRIVGVCRDTKTKFIKETVEPMIYLPFRQFPFPHTSYMVRTALPPATLATAAQRVVAAINPQVPVVAVTSQAEIRDRSIGQEHLLATLCATLAGLALLLACLGLYGLMAYNVARRTTEIGIRMALGATTGNVAAAILREALTLAVIGVTLGLLAVFGAMRLLGSQLYGVTAHDPLTLSAVTTALIGVTLLAAWLPARRATRVDPMIALRAE